MAYDIHIVRTKNWLPAADSRITKQDIDVAVGGDPELEWCTSDYVDMADDSGSVTRDHMNVRNRSWEAA